MFSADSLTGVAKARFGEGVLRNRMRGAGADDEKADQELDRVSAGVIGRAEAALSMRGQWPIPGAWPAGSVDAAEGDISGQLYADVWPANLLQMALDLFNWRTVAGLDVASDNIKNAGKMAEAWFTNLENGIVNLGIEDTTTETGQPAPISARNRDGSSNTGDCWKPNQLDSFRGFGWDFY